MHNHVIGSSAARQLGSSAARQLGELGCRSRCKISMGWCFAFGLATTAFQPTAWANFAIEHQGSSDPLGEGFSIVTCCGSGVTAQPIPNDLGLAAWSIGGGSNSAQFSYASGPLSAQQKAEIDSGGFVLTLNARILAGTAPADTLIAGANLSRETGSFQIELGLDNSGDLFVMLADSLNTSGSGGSVRGSGRSYTISGNNDAYHEYQLIYDPTTLSASLLVDGVTRLTGYQGSSQFKQDHGLGFSVMSGGRGNYNLVSLASTKSAEAPEPATLLLSLAPLALIGVASRRRTG
jgi:hypothetical protein